MINWNTVPMTYNDSLTYMEMMGKVLTVVQQMYDTLTHIVIDSEQININKEDIADLKESVSELSNSVSDLTGSVSALSDSVDGLTNSIQTLETLTAGRTTPEYQALSSTDITIHDNTIFRISIPESIQSADGYLISFSFACVFSGTTYHPKVTILIRDEVAHYYTYIPTSDGDEPIRLDLYGITPTNGYIEFAAFSDANSYSITADDEGGIVAFYEKTE